MVHAANPPRHGKQKPDDDPLTPVSFEHRDGIKAVPGNVAEPVPVAAGVGRLDQAHDFVARRLSDTSKRVVGGQTHEDKIRIPCTKSNDLQSSGSPKTRQPCRFV